MNEALYIDQLILRSMEYTVEPASATSTGR